VIEDVILRISLFNESHKAIRVRCVSEELSVEVASSSSAAWNRISQNVSIFSEISVCSSEIAARFDPPVVDSASVFDVEVTFVSAVEFLRALDDGMVVVGTACVEFAAAVDVRNPFG